MSHFSCTSVRSRSEEKATAQVKFPLTLKLGIGFRLVSDLSKERFEMTKRLVEVFTAGCPLCDETVKLVRELICSGYIRWDNSLLRTLRAARST